jgi:hypothetical protein
MTTPPAIPLFKVFMAPPAALMPRLEAVLYSGQISEGEPVAEFEQRFGDFVGNPHCLSFYSGTAALHIALLLAGVQPGDDVVSTAMTAEPTNLAIRHAGATPRWADVDPRNGNVTAQTIAAALTPRTRAILVVHYGGIPGSDRRDPRTRRAAWSAGDRRCRARARRALQRTPTRQPLAVRDVLAAGDQTPDERRRRHADARRS